MQPREAPARRSAAATIHIDLATRIVTKQYGAGTFEAALREYLRLERVHRALEGDPALASPRPLSLEAAPPGVRMELCDGVPLVAILARRCFSSEELERLGRALARGLRVYVAATGEAYRDFCPQNALYDDRSGRVVLLDFAPPRSQAELGAPVAPVPLALGNFLGCSLYELARPANARARLARRQFVQLYRGVRGALLEDGSLRHADLASVEAIACLTYRRVTAPGRTLRRAWYRTVGLLNFQWNLRRLRLQPG